MSNANRNRQALLGLAALVAIAIAAWLLFRRAREAREVQSRAVDDDLEMLARIVDGSALPAQPHDRLVLGAKGAYVLLAGAGVVEHVSQQDAGIDVLTRVPPPAWDMALGGDSLWITGGGGVTRAPLDGSPTSLVAAGLSHPQAIASDGRWVFAVDVDAAPTGMLHASRVVRIATGGGGAPSVVGSYQGEVTNIALDGTSAFWADRLEGTILAAPEAGGEPRALTHDRGLPEQVLVDATSVYWIEKRSESLWKMPKAGGAPVALARDFAGFAHAVVHGESIAWVNESAVDGGFRVLSVPVAGGEERTVSETVDGIDALASDGAHLYWLRGGAVSEVAQEPK
ncbi:MAG TPA: hypothetical protein VF765_34785 [Polyangiaceae bacterium]